MAGHHGHRDLHPQAAVDAVRVRGGRAEARGVAHGPANVAAEPGPGLPSDRLVQRALAERRLLRGLVRRRRLPEHALVLHVQGQPVDPTGPWRGAHTLVRVCAVGGRVRLHLRHPGQPRRLSLDRVLRRARLRGLGDHASAPGQPRALVASVVQAAGLGLWLLHLGDCGLPRRAAALPHGGHVAAPRGRAPGAARSAGGGAAQSRHIHERFPRRLAASRRSGSAHAEQRLAHPDLHEPPAPRP
mmetsp:Transcript_18132/g.57645  ORF Transcript_18132/g.57645 Transcript_18132/m.57645 type:complete len:243 (-) Transcript_18132:1136-1864(-)